MSCPVALQSGDGRPLVSVVIPAYNAREFILDALDGVLAQQYEPIEILLVDDGSSDHTGELVEAGFPRVRVISQVNRGVASARNTGLAAAKGKYIAFLDADDVWFPGKLNAQVSYLELHPEVGMVFHRWQVWMPEPSGQYRIPPRSSAPSKPLPVENDWAGWLYIPLLLDCVVHTSTVMIRREVAAEVGEFDPTLINGEDYDYWLRASRVCEIHQLDAVYSLYRSVADGLTAKVKPINYEYSVLQRAIAKWGGKDPVGREIAKPLLAKRLAKLAMDFGYAHSHRGSARVALHSYIRGLRHDPWRLRAWLHVFVCGLQCIFGARRGDSS